MAEFKLGRIKFVYQGTWQPSTSYVVDDVVTNGGKAYICVISNTSSSAFTTDLNNVTPYWNLISDGQSWKSTWANSTYYNPGDLVQYGGIVYLCTTAHTSASATATLTATAATANGTTATITFAALNSGVQPYTVGTSITVAGFTSQTAFNGTFTVTACTPTTVSYALAQTLTGTTMGTVSGTGVLGLEVNQSNWSAFASNLNWLGAWATNTRYKVDDFVYYGGITYVCNTAHVSANTTALGLETNDLSKWSAFNSGLNYLGSWATATRYKLNDIVKYGADLWICTTQHTSSGSTLNTSNFTLFVNGFEFMNSYNPSTAYIVGDVVTYGGYTYTCIQNGTNQTPSTATGYWQVFTSGITFAGAWVTGTSYKVGQVVTLGGYTYVAIADNSASQPPSANWSQLNSGIRWNAAPTTTYSAVASTNLVSAGGNGSATFDVTLTGTAYSVVVHSGAGGSGYAVNDTLTIAGTNLGGTIANNLVVQVATISGSAIATVSVVSGYAVTWKSGMVYVVGDAVYYGNSSYICISAHVGASGNNPIADTSGTYWNVLAGGADSGVLTTTGDIVYYGTNGATRLPIGTDGQVLRVGGNIPSWSYYGLLNNIVYVAQNGSDVSGNGQGLTLDKPWASLLYACKQIEDGYLNPNAGQILKLNKQFMLKEVNNFILTQYSFNVTGTSASNNTFTVGGSSTSSQITTANMYYGMPITFSQPTGGVTVGTTYYVNTIPSTTTFTISTSYQSGATLGITPSSTVPSIATFSYDQSKTERDAGTLIDCVVFDLTHGGNLYVTNAVQQFFSTLTSYITNNAKYEVTVWIASLAYLENTLFASVMGNNAPANNYQSLQGIPVANRAIQNTTQVSTVSIESGAQTTAQNLLAVVVGALTAGTYANIPQLQRPHTSIYLKTGTYNEYGPIVLSQDTAILGDELRSTVVQTATAQPYLGNDGPKTAAALQRVQAVLSNLISNATVTPTSTGPVPNTQSQITNLPAGDTGNSSAVTLVVNNTRIIQDMMAGGTIITGPNNPNYGQGLVYQPAFSMPSVSNYNTYYLIGYGDAKAQLVQNYQFIKDEIANYLNNTLSGTTWAGYGPAYQAETIRDLSNVLDALQYDLTYGCNNQSLSVGSSFYSLNTALIVAPYTTGVLAALNRLSAILPYVLDPTDNGTASSASLVSSGNTTAQVTTGTSGSQAAVKFAQARVADIIYFLNNNGFPNTTTGTTTGYISGTTLTVASGTGLAIGQLVSSTVLTTTATATNNSTGLVSLSSTLGLVSGMTITFSTPYTYGNQFAFGGLTQTSYTINTVTANSGVTLYNFGTTTPATLTTSTGKMTATIGIAPGTYITAGSGTSWTVSVSQTYGSSGTQLPITGTLAITPQASGAIAFATPANQASFNAINARYNEIATDATAWVQKFYQNESPSLVLTNRDAGYVVTALMYDVLFNSNFYSIITGRAYNRLIPLSAALLAQFADSTYGSIGFIGERVKLLAANGAVAQTSAVIDEMVATIYGQPTNNATFNGTINGTQITVNSISSGVLTTGMSLSGIGINSGTSLVAGATISITTPAITSITGVFSCAALTSPLVVGQQVTISGTFSAGSISGYSSGSTYYVIGSPTTTAFQLSATQGGTAVTSTTSGGTITGLTITASPTTWLTNYSQSVSSTTTAIVNVIPTTNYVTMGTTSGMVPGLQVTVSGTSISNLTPGVYYIKQVLNTTQLTLSSTYNGSTLAITPLNTLTGVQIVGTNGQFTCNAVSSTLLVGQPVTISGTYGGAGSITGYATPTTYYIIATNGSTSFTLSATTGGSAIVTTAGTPTGLTYTTGATGAMTAIVYGIYGGLGTTTTITASGTNIPVSGVTTSSNLITLRSNAGVYANMPIVFSGLPSPITTSAIQTIGSTTNTVTLAGTASSLGIVAGQKIWFSGANLGGIVNNQIYYVINPSGSTIQLATTFGGSAVSLQTSPTLSTVAITGTAGQFSCASSTLVVGQAVTINGTLSAGTINGSATVTATTFYIITTNGSTTFTLSATLGGLAITSTSSGGTITGAVFGLNAQLTTTVNAAGGLTNGNIYWVNSITAGTYPNAGTTITITNSYKSGTAYVITNTLTNLTATASIGLATSQGTPSKIINGTVMPGFGVKANASASGYNNTLTTINGSEIIRANRTFLANEMISYELANYGGTVTATATNGTFTTSSAHNLTVGDPVQFGLTGTIFDANVTAGTVYWILSTPTTTTFTVTTTQAGTGTQNTLALVGGTGSMNVAYYIIMSKAVRDATYHLDGLVYDLGKTGNYKTLRSVQLYLSAVNGSTTTDMFHVQNGTGIRNMTCNGLTGSLGLPNTFGTRRPTAGSYVSFDPGFGPNDSSAWISQRSPYTQNITNFGSGCVGMKIDAALHNGGNKSMVCNDFTQVLSDGIGIYCTGSGAITEAVSVFCYYGYAGYLSELGGRIRATNGNSSYGTYGVIAEGIDSFETPIYATLNNRYNQAYVTNVITDVQNQVYRLEFENAGNTYTNAIPTVSGSGYNIATTQDEFRDSAVFETRLVDLNNGQGVGGSNYLTISNVAQVGAVGSITIANSDTNLSSAYPGMRIQITAGTGVGQYANIIAYSSASKIANIVRPNFTSLTITASSGSSTYAFTVASTATMYAGQPILLGAAIAGLSTATVYYVTTGFSSTTFQVSDTAPHAIAGTNVYSLTATSATPATMAGSTIVGNTLTIGGSITNTIYVGMLLSGGTVAANTYITAGSGTSWTVSVSQNMASTTLTGTISVPVYEAGWDHAIPGNTIQPVLDATSTYIIEPAVAYTSPGFSATSRTLSGAGNTWAGLTYGQGNFVATAAGATATSYSTDGKTWTAGGALPSITTWNNVVYGGGQGATASAVVGGVGGSGAVLTTTVGTGTTAGQVVSITVVNGGYNYVTPPTIVITDSTGVGATAICQVLNGTIQSVTMTITGSGYTNPTVTVVTSELTSITANTWGQNYFTSPTVTIAPPFTATAWTSSGSATANAYYYYVSPNVRNYYQAGASGTFSSTAPTFTNGVYGKSGYGASGVGASGTYGVALTYVGTLAVATANLTNNGVSSFTINQSGYGYATAPTITITDPNAGFLAISSASTANAYNLPTTLGSAWTANSNVLPTSTMTSLAYGNNLFIAVGGSGSAAAASITGAPSTAWTNQSSNIIANTAGYSAVAYGAGVFVAIGGTVTAWMKSDPTTWSTGGSLPSKTWVSVTYGNGRFVALASDGTVCYTTNWQTGGWGTSPNVTNNTWVTIKNNPLNTPGTITTWKTIRYGEGLFFAVATSSQTCATSWDGVNWTLYPTGMPSSSNWTGLAFGNPQNATLGAVPTWVSVSNTSGTIAASIATGATPQGRVKVVSNAVSEIRMIEPGSGFPRGNVTATTYYASTSVTVNSSATTTITLASAATLVQGQPIVFASSFGNVVAGTVYYVYATTTASTSVQISTILNGTVFTVGTGTSLSITGTVSSLSLVTVSDTTNLAANQPVVFNGTSQGGITTGQYYYIVPNSITSTQFQVAVTAGGSSFTATTAVISSMTYFASPITTITDPNSVNKAPVTARIGNGALGNPSFTNRGTGNTTATASYGGDGYADLYQTGTFINVSGLYQIPKAGCNITFSSISNTWYKLVQVTNQLGIAGNYTATFQINPGLSTLLAPPNGTLITTNLLYSNTRMTGHDFLYIGTGGLTATNYPNIDPTKAVQANQTISTGGGRVFFTSTDQDGNFNVGNLFGVQQSTGTATLNASAFNLAGLQSLTLGSVSLGVGSATITQFSTDPYFTANSDSVVPTQKAIKAFITAQIGGGQSTLNVNTITSGQIYIAGNTISNTTSAQIYVASKMLFTGGIDGAPVALAFFTQH
jgi:hypothetical protein